MTAVSWLALVIVLALTVGLAWALVRMLVPAKGKPMVCATCGHLGPSVQHTKGSLGVEVVLWLAFLLPGMIYSIWRLVTRKAACAECRGTTLVPPESPIGRRMLREARRQQRLDDDEQNVVSTARPGR